MTATRLVAAASSVGFATLCATLAQVDRIPRFEAAWAAAAVALALLPTGWWAPAGWRRRAAEAVLVLPAWALLMVGDPVQRRMLLPPLLAAAAWAAVVAAWSRVPLRRRAILLVLFAVSARAACGMGLAGWPWWRIVIAFAASGVAAWAAGRLGGRDLAIAVSLLAAAVPVQVAPVLGAVAVVASLIAGPLGDPFVCRTGGRGWLPGLAAVGFLCLSSSAWGGLAFDRAFADAGPWTVAALVAALVVTRWLPAGAAGAIWLAVAFTVGPALEPTPDRRGMVLGGEQVEVELPSGTGERYVVDIGLDSAVDLPVATPVAVLRIGDVSRDLLFPEHALPRAGAGGGHRSERAIWRPHGSGSTAGWRAAARSLLEVPSGVVPRLRKHPDLPAEVSVVVEAEGPAVPTPPRSRSLAWWLAAAAVAVATLQLLSGTWRWTFAVVPWTVLVAGELAARARVEPLHLLAERHAPDLALATLLAAWLPAAVVWLERRRVAAVVAGLLIPLAVAAPALGPPLHGDEPFHLAVMRSLASDGDLELDNNLDLEFHPQEAVYDRDGHLLHSPALGIALLPGFLLAGRAGTLVVLALVGAAAAALVARRARRLGVPEARLRWLVLVLAATYPVAVFATQVWVELPGALAVAAILVAAAGGRGGRWAAVAWAVVATSVKTRLGLLAFPPALAGWWRRPRGRVLGVVVVALAVAASLAVGWLAMGHPFGIYRRLRDLVPADPRLAARVLGGLAVDPTGGLLFAAPLWLVALAGVAALWRRGGPAERALLVGCAATVAALLHSLEWYGGGSPPARYLVPMLPAVALAGVMVLREPRRWRRLAELLLLPSLVLWWVLITRPHLSINPGDGGWWATDALARSYLADTAWLVPSFLVPRAATLVVPLALAVVVLLLWASARWRPSVARRLAASGAALWLLAAAGLVAAVELRTDRIVEAEAPQVRRHGGEPVPRPGTFSRFTHRRGWKLVDGQSVTFPLNLPADAEVWLEGWLLGAAQRGAALELSWNDGEPKRLRVHGVGRDGRRAVPEVPGAGHHRLTVTVQARSHGAVVLDRVVVEAPQREPRVVAPALPRLVILYVLDALRADHVGGTGWSPTLDRLAAEGVSFTDCLSVAPNTLPSTKALFTGRFFFDSGALPGGAETIAEVMRSAGFRTVGISGNGYVSPKFGMTRGFDSFEMVYPHARGADPATYVNRNAADIHRRALEILASGPIDEPIFMYLHTIHPHNPFAPPRDLAEAMCGEIPSSVDGMTETLLAIRDREREVDDADRRRLKCLYAASLRFNDSEIENLLGRLARLYRPGELLLIVTSDHGEELFDHGGLLHGHTVYEEVLRIPLILWWPDRLAPATIDLPVDTFDLHATLRALVEEGPSGPGTEGRSLWPVVLKGDEVPLPRRPRFAAVPTLPGGIFMARSETHKLVLAPRAAGDSGMGLGLGRSHDPEYFFDLGADPGELENLAGGTSPEEQRLRASLRAWIERHRGNRTTSEVELDDGLRDHLEALGYVE